MIDYTAILTRRYPGRQWTLNGDDYDGLVMLDGSEKPSKKELDALWPEIAAEIATAIDNKAALLASARAKLAALGLTADEIAAFLG